MPDEVCLLRIVPESSQAWSVRCAAWPLSPALACQQSHPSETLCTRSQYCLPVAKHMTICVSTAGLSNYSSRQHQFQMGAEGVQMNITLLTTVLMEGFLSSITCNITTILSKILIHILDKWHAQMQKDWVVTFSNWCFHSKWASFSLHHIKWQKYGIWNVATSALFNSTTGSATKNRMAKAQELTRRSGKGVTWPMTYL